MTAKLNEAIAAARARKGFTLRDVEDMTGLSSALVSQIETGTIKEPSFRSIVRLARVLGLNLSRLADEPLMMPVIEEAPGLRWSGVNGRREARWRADPEFVKRGYLPKSVQLWIGERLSAADKKFIVSRCENLQQEMIMWGTVND